jgi:hypothetical protein
VKRSVEPFFNRVQFNLIYHSLFLLGNIANGSTERRLAAVKTSPSISTKREREPPAGRSWSWTWAVAPRAGAVPAHFWWWWWRSRWDGPAATDEWAEARSWTAWTGGTGGTAAAGDDAWDAWWYEYDARGERYFFFFEEICN